MFGKLVPAFWIFPTSAGPFTLFGNFWSLWMLSISERILLSPSPQTSNPPHSFFSHNFVFWCIPQKLSHKRIKSVVLTNPTDFFSFLICLTCFKNTLFPPLFSYVILFFLSKMLTNIVNLLNSAFTLLLIGLCKPLIFI